MGLELNLAEIEVRKAYLLALALAFETADHIDDIWGRAVTNTPEEAREWLWKINAARHSNRNRGR